MSETCTVISGDSPGKYRAVDARTESAGSVFLTIFITGVKFGSGVDMPLPD